MNSPIFEEKCNSEKKWFESDYETPPGIPPGLLEDDISNFQNLIWKMPYNEVLTKYGDTANDLAVLCSENRDGWLMSSHMYHFLDMANEAQQEGLCLCLPGPAPQNVKKLYLARPETKTLFFICNVLQRGGETVLATAQTPGNHWALVVVNINEPRILYCDSLGWACPTNLVNILEQFTVPIGLSLSNYVVCAPSYFPVQTCENVCGIVAIIFALIGAVDKDWFLNITSSPHGPYSFLHEPTRFESFLRRVLISWFISRKIRLDLFLVHEDHTYCKTTAVEQSVSKSVFSQETVKNAAVFSQEALEDKAKGKVSGRKIEETKQVSCPYCHMSVSSINLSRHKKRFHYNAKKENGNESLIKCIECQLFTAPSIQSLIQHMQTTHNKDININTRQFQSRDEFQEWKIQTEKEKRTKFILDCGSYTKDSIMTSYYICNRSGRKIIKINSSKFRKTQGTCKLDQKCTSFLKVKENLSNGSIELEYCLDHSGHSVDLAHLSLSDGVRKTVAVKLSQGIDPSRILDDARDEIVEVDRDALLTRQDIHNIKKQYHISQTEKHTDDGQSVNLWVQSWKTRSNNPIIYYKSQGCEHETLKKEDFLLCFQTPFQKQMMKSHAKKLICIDSTHKTNQYDFYLTTISVIDDFEEGIPVAFAISNKEDAGTLFFFMQAVKDSCGQDFIVHFFMSDLACNSYNAWCSVFSKPLNRLYCSWHVDRSWRKNIDEFVKSPEDRQKIYNSLKLLQANTNEAEFWELLNEFLTYLYTHAPKFHDYFLKTYVLEGKVTHWAGCFRIGTLANTNMFAEAFHRVLKEIYFGKRQNRRVDFLLITLVKISRDKSIEQLVKLEKGKVTHRIKEVRVRHRNAVDVKYIFKSSEGEWVVASVSDKDVFYMVTKDEIDSCPCRLVCDLCHVCVHMYTCACDDYLLNAVSCKHIHAVHMSEGKSVDVCNGRLQVKETDIENKRLIQNNLSTQNMDKSQDPTSLNVTIKKYASEILDIVSKNSNIALLQEVKKCMKNTRDVAVAFSQIESKQSFKKTCQIPSNKRHDIQRRLFSTKKKRKKRELKFKLKKPDHTSK